MHDCWSTGGDSPLSSMQDENHLTPCRPLPSKNATDILDVGVWNLFGKEIGGSKLAVIDAFG